MRVFASAVLLWSWCSNAAFSHVIPHGRRTYNGDDDLDTPFLVKTWSGQADFSFFLVPLVASILYDELHLRLILYRMYIHR